MHLSPVCPSLWPTPRQQHLVQHGELKAHFNPLPVAVCPHIQHTQCPPLAAICTRLMLEFNPTSSNPHWKLKITPLVPNTHVPHFNSLCTIPHYNNCRQKCASLAGLWTSLHSLSLRSLLAAVRRAARSGRGHTQEPGAAEPFWHFSLSPPNPLCWPQSDECLTKKTDGSNWYSP